MPLSKDKLITMTSALTLNQLEQRATRTIFFIAGLGMSSWAPLIPFIQRQLNADEAMLGGLLFCIAAGSMIMMPFTGRLIRSVGCRPLILLGGLGLGLDLLLLVYVQNLLPVAIALLFFGAFNGLLDVAMNAQAVTVERHSGQARMSGFHGFYSIGSIAGAGCISLLLWSGLSPLMAVMIISVIITLLVVWSRPYLLKKSTLSQPGQSGTLKVLRHKKILFIGLLCFFIFLCEGAMLDWSAVLMVSERAVPAQQAGLGFTLYSLAVALCRLNGDRLIQALGSAPVALYGSLLAAAGIGYIVAFDAFWINAAGFLMAGAGIANIIPVLFSAAGNQSGVLAEYSLPAITLLGYSGLLAGPALIGIMARQVGLIPVFASGAVLLMLAGISAWAILHQRPMKM